MCFIVREHFHKQTQRNSMHNCSEGAAIQTDIVQQSTVNEKNTGWALKRKGGVWTKAFYPSCLYFQLNSCGLQQVLFPSAFHKKRRGGGRINTVSQITCLKFFPEHDPMQNIQQRWSQQTYGNSIMERANGTHVRKDLKLQIDVTWLQHIKHAPLQLGLPRN